MTLLFNNADRLAGPQAVSMLLWKVPALRTPRTPETWKGICPLQLHPLPSWICEGLANRFFRNNASFRPFWQGLFILADFVEFCNGKSLPTRKAFCFGTECTKVKESMVWYSLYKSELTVWVAAKRSAWLMINNVMTPNRANHLAVAPWLPNSENRRGCQRRALPVHLDRWQCWMALLSLW